MYTFWLLLLFGVATLGGLIAWLGDNVGRHIGRKHLRIFGLRPRTTGLLFAVGSGVLVAFATVGTVSLLARSTVNNALRAPEMLLELEKLKGELKKINLQSEESRRNLQKMRDQRLLAQQEFEQVRAELEQRQQELNATAELNERLNARVAELERERDSLGAQIQSKTNELERLSRVSTQRTLALKREIGTLEAQRAESGSQIQRLSTQRIQLQSRIETLSKERSILENAVLSAQTATQAALRRQSNLENTVASLEAGRDKLEAQQLQLETQRNQLQAERNQLIASVTKLENKSQQLENQSQVLRNERNKLQGDIAELNQTRASLEASVNRLERQNNNLTQQLNSAEAQLRETQTALAEATSGNFIFRQGELVSQLLLESNSPDILREQLQTWIKQAASVAQVRGATRSKAVVVKPSPDLEPYISEAQRSKGSDLILMRTSRSVTQTGIELPVTLEVRPNEALYTSGQPIRLRELMIGAAKGSSSLRLSVENLLRDSGRELLERGVPRENLPNPLVPVGELGAFLSQLESNSGSVWVAVAARRDLTPAGPIQVYLSLMR
ncbi:MAG: DUF3084 domain-containing protein [Deinococcales bacterium]